MTRAYRPSLFGEQPKKKKKRVGVEELIRRYNNGLDLWSGEPLKGKEATEWLQDKFKSDNRS